MNTFQLVEQAARQRDLECVVIGGIAVIEHGYGRLTTDFDLMTRWEEKQKWHEMMLSLGYQLIHDKGHFAQYEPVQPGNWPIDLMFVNEQTFSGIRAAARQATLQGAHLNVASLNHLLALKLHALKHSHLKRFLKDFDDVIHLVQVNRIDLRSAAMQALFLKYGNADLYGKICRACEAK